MDQERGVNQDVLDWRMDQERGVNQDVLDWRMDQERGLNQDAKDWRMDQDNLLIERFANPQRVEIFFNISFLLGINRKK
ncbi:hypothetical protein [Sphingobacterium sp.]|uniref:hypothetical protein n=1 Tax=Sphingobacterium sp. TaxID=341027 RepID=UPI0028AFC5D1|nr:hypothetical protein [Sphingobacterium sp.]